jgi:hypothetical protein
VLATSLSGNFAPGPRINLFRPTPEPGSIDERIRALKKAGVRGNLDQLRDRIAHDEPGAMGELEALERMLNEGVKGEEIEVLEQSRAFGQKSPDFRVRGELVEVKTRELPLSKRYFSDEVGYANAQFKDCGLDAGRPMVGTNTLGPQGHLEFQLRGEAARTATFDLVERQVLKGFTPAANTSVRRVSVYAEGRLLGEWIRTAANTIQRTSPPP